MNVLAFSIKTIPDVDGGKRIYSLDGLDDESVSKALFHIRKQQTGNDELALYLQRIVSISIVYRGIGKNMNNQTIVKSLGEEDTTEEELLSLFFTEIKDRAPVLISWDGVGFDLPLIQYRSLKNNVSAPEFWEKISNSGFIDDQEGYGDLKRMLSGFDASLNAPLNHIALLLGVPNFDDLDTAQVWKAFLDGNIKNIRDYSELNALKIYLIYLRSQLIQGEITNDQLLEEYALLKASLRDSGEEHLQRFSESWKQ